MFFSWIAKVHVTLCLGKPSYTYYHFHRNTENLQTDLQAELVFQGKKKCK